MKALLPAGLALWSTLACVATYVALAPREVGTAVSTAGAGGRESEVVTVPLPGGDETIYLSFRLRHERLEGASETVPVEAAAKDVLISAARGSRGFARGKDWKDEVAAALREAAPLMGLASIELVAPRRLGAPSR